MVDAVAPHVGRDDATELLGRHVVAAALAAVEAALIAAFIEAGAGQRPRVAHLPRGNAGRHFLPASWRNPGLAVDGDRQLKLEGDLLQVPLLVVGTIGGQGALDQLKHDGALLVVHAASPW